MKNALGVSIALYVISGVATPLFMTLVDSAGLGNKSALIYMLFYGLGPASVSILVLLEYFCDIFHLNLLEDEIQTGRRSDDGSEVLLSEKRYRYSMWLNWRVMMKFIGINCIDVLAQALNYTGSIMAGPTIFATIYSSLTIWTALYSRVLLSRYINFTQWSGVLLVFGGVAITSLNAISITDNVFVGSLLVIFGSSLHSLTYVLNEAILKHNGVEGGIPVAVGCAVEGVFGSTVYLFWQLIYTRKYWDDLIMKPMEEAGTTMSRAFKILLCLSMTTLVHDVCYFFILKHCPGGSVSAGIMKGLQAVLVFVFTSVFFCGRVGGEEMCFNSIKLMSLCVVIVGVLVFGKGTQKYQKHSRPSHGDGYDVVTTY